MTTDDENADPRLVPGERGPDLILSRSLAVGVDEAWATLTDPARTTHWFGPWEGEGVPGGTIRVQMRFEEGDPWVPMRIDACERPTRLAVSMLEDQGDWRLELVLAETAGRTRLSLIHHLTGVDGLGEIGPGWDFYLDLFVAAVRNEPSDAGSVPVFTDYYPARSALFIALAGRYASVTPGP